MLLRLPHEIGGVRSYRFILPVSATRCVVRHRSHLGRDEDYFSAGGSEKLPAESLVCWCAKKEDVYARDRANDGNTAKQ